MLLKTIILTIIKEKLLQNNIQATGHDIKSENNFVEFGNNFISSKSDFFNKNDVFLTIVRDKRETDELLVNNDVLKSKKNATILICSTLFLYIIQKTCGNKMF